MRPTDDYVQIAGYGGGLILDLSSRPTEDWVKVAGHAAGKGSQLIFRNAGSRPTADLVRIASHGKGVVVFDFTA